MNSTVDKETIEEENNIEVAENEFQPQYFDSLNRTDFVKNVIQIIENLSAQKASKCYAIKGTWGVGKTHVLDMIEKELFNEYRQANAYDKYILFHYNAWKYDYYYEPLVSMVASMVESVDEERSFISPALKKKFKGFLNGVFKAFNALNKVRGKQEVFPNGTTSNSENNSSQFFDSNCHLNKTMKKLKEGLGKMSSDVTIIVVVDELDRCLPEYAIKVLERLHHIFNGMENTQVILSVDYDQLENTVKTIFGENTSTKRYLSKFINFSIALDEGHLAQNFDRQFSDYIDNFEFQSKYSYIVKAEHVEQFKNLIFEGIDMRQRKEVVNRSHLIHTLINSGEEKLDVSYMCIEIVLTLWKSIIDNRKTKFYHPYCFSYGIERNTSNNDPISISKGLKELENIYETASRQHSNGFDHRYYVEEQRYNYVKLFDLWGIVLLAMAEIAGHECRGLSNSHFNDAEYLDYVDKYWEMLQIIN